MDGSNLVWVWLPLLYLRSLSHFWYSFSSSFSSSSVSNRSSMSFNNSSIFSFLPSANPTKDQSLNIQSTCTYLYHNTKHWQLLHARSTVATGKVETNRYLYCELMYAVLIFQTLIHKLAPQNKGDLNSFISQCNQIH